ncbi:hypothetical protein BC962_0859 [Gillisia mitskevichiae]|uniref:Uncharacterized protein n=1 Tax=Gillisia mitskevichiae TaxID=270921 RepID=A0A495PZD3_9FLAO|nr:hypothetical protein [Gillisia mitskevichiae]RKS55885.1 hypothetical protein BC962_0859 [Gillisia mitskevichiae]
MTEQELAEILKYSSPNTLYVVAWNNLLTQLFCPFKVIVKHHIGELKIGQKVWVDNVKVTSSLTTVFIVKGRAYYFYHFEILDPE